MRYFIPVGICLALTIVVGPRTAQAQQVTAAITGKVSDPSGAPIASAKVEAVDTQRGTLWNTVTNSDGLFNLPTVPVGNYNVKVDSPGFAAAQQTNLTLVLNQVARLDFQLQIGNVATSMEVSAAAALLKTDSTQLDTVIDARTNEALPLATRNYVQLTLLAPGSVATDPSSFTGPEATFNGGRPYINGNRNEANNFILDGMDNNQISENAVGYTPSVDAIEEFNMITQNASAQFGNFMGGIVSVSIKSGTNRVHGSAFEFLRNDALNANDWGNNWNGLPRPLLRWNEFGGTIGGPILKDKLFFFADYQGSRFDQPATSSAFTVFTAAERTGDFSQLLSQGVQLNYPMTKTPIPGNIIPMNLLSSQALSILSSSLYPTATNGNLINNSENTTHSSTNGNQGDVKVDWTASEKDRVSVRYSQSAVENPTTNSIPLLYNESNTYPSYNGVFAYTRTFSPSIVNEFRAGVNYIPVITGALSGNSTLTAQSIGIPGVPTSVLPGFNLTSGNFSNEGSAFGNPQVAEEFSDTVGQISDTAIVNHGKHTYHIGFQIMRERIDTFYSGNAGIAGQFDFNGQYTGSAESDFIFGLPNEVQGGIAGGTWGQRSTVASVFAQDDWRIANNITINIGLRYEVNTPWVEVENRQANFGLVSGTEYLAGSSNCPYSNCRALYNQYNGITNYQPRIGIAWTPMKNLVVRAAATTSSFLEGTGTNLRLTLNPPFATEHDILYTPTQTPSTLRDGYLPFAANAGNQFEGASIRVWDPNIRPAVSNQWNFTLQRSFGQSATLQVGYVGQRNNHLMVPIFAGQKILNADGSVSPGYYLSGNPTLQSEIGAAKLTQSSANQSYNALQVSFQKRLSNGLEFLANYTYSKCLTNSIGYYGDGGQASTNDYYWPNPYDGRSQWGPCYYDVTHAFNGYVTYDLPIGRGRMLGTNMNRAANAVVGGWQVNSIVNWRGGFPYTIDTGYDSSGTGAAEPRADCLTPGTVYGERNAPTGGYQWFNPSAYAIPQQGTFGNCGVGTIRGPGLHEADLSLSKTFAVTEHQNLEFRAEAINVTNTKILGSPNIGVPGDAPGTIGTSGGNFGTITSSQGARNIQFALKLHF